MPSVPSRLAAACACALVFSLAAPALADKSPGKSPPPPVSGLQPPGQQGPSSSGGQGSSSAPRTQTPAATPPGSGGVAEPQYTQKMNKGKGGGGSSSGAQRGSGNGNGRSNFTPKQDKGKSAAPQSAPSQGGSTPVTTPAGGNTPAPTTPATPGGGSKAKPKSKAKRHSTANNRRASRPAPVTTPRPSTLVTRPVRPVGLPARPAPAAAPQRPARTDQNGRGFDRLPVSVVTQTVHDIVQVIPAPVKAVIGAMAALLLAAVAAWAAVTVRSRRLRRHQSKLLQEVGLLQAALLPEVPPAVGPLAASVAYRPADGPGAGGDFYDVFRLEGGQVGLVLGDVAGHGRDALARTALLRYTLRAYLETGLEPRTAVRLAGETLDHSLGGGFATAAVAVYDPYAGTLTYSCAGHPPPILLGPPAHDPITTCSAPPIGVGERTGIRQTTVPLPADSVACFFTDGLAEARVSGELFGRERIIELIAEMGPDATAPELIERVRAEAHHLPDDMAACILRPLVSAGSASEERVEELELRDGGERHLRSFLAACGVAPIEIGDLVRSAQSRAADYGGAVVRVAIADGRRPHVSLVLPLIESLAA